MLRTPPGYSWTISPISARRSAGMAATIAPALPFGVDLDQVDAPLPLDDGAEGVCVAGPATGASAASCTTHLSPKGATLRRRVSRMWGTGSQTCTRLVVERLSQYAALMPMSTTTSGRTVP